LQYGTGPKNLPRHCVRRNDTRQARYPTSLLLPLSCAHNKPGAEQVRVDTLEESAAILDVFQAHGHSEIDTAIVYGGGSSEQYLGQLHWKERGIVMDTKFSPRTDLGLGPDVKTTHSPEHLRLALKKSLESLKTDKIDMWYLHAPERSTPYEVTLREVNNLHNEGYFRRFGISNYAAWEVAQICEICDQNGWIKVFIMRYIERSSLSCFHA